MSDVVEFNKLYISSIKELSVTDPENAHKVLKISKGAMQMLLDMPDHNGLLKNRTCLVKASCIEAGQFDASSNAPVHPVSSDLNFHLLALIRHISQTSERAASGVTGVSAKVCSIIKSMPLIKLQRVANANPAMFSFCIAEKYMQNMVENMQNPEIYETMQRFAAVISTGVC